MFKLTDRISTALQSRARNFYWQMRGVKIEGYSWLQAIEIPRNHYEIKIEKGCALDRGIVLLCSGDPQGSPKIIIGEGTYINRNVFLDATKLIQIGERCGIGPGCYLTDHDHGLDPELAPLEQTLISKSTRIGDRVWIGANVTILKGVTIGEDAVIGAGSVVTKDIPAQSIAVGNPAKVIRYKTD
ncbi:MAG: acyltransferase [Limnothrix sp. RL_2_0]|nr:acyltransferase [Limnothrix sp. RL_2_0]